MRLDNLSAIAKSERIPRMISRIFADMPEVEADRAVIVTQSYRSTESQPIIARRAEAFYSICENLPITIRPEELIAGSASIAPRGCQVFPEYSYEWLERELDDLETRSADPFFISEEAKKRLREVFPYWKGKTNSDLAFSLMAPEARAGISHNIFTPGNYFYNGIGHFCVKYDEVLAIGFSGIRSKAEKELDALAFYDPHYACRSAFLKAVIRSCDAAVVYARRYCELARRMSQEESDPQRRAELARIAENCSRVPEFPAESFWEACQAFWFTQLLLQLESSGHSISPGRFDIYMNPYYEADKKNGAVSLEFAQELLDCLWVKLNDLNKVRDKDSAEGFSGYSLFQNLIVGGQDEEGRDSTNDLSYMCLEASKHVLLPAPSLSIRVWNGSPRSLLLKAAETTRTGIGLPAYYNDEAIIPSLMNRGLSLEDARTYCIIGCVEPHKAGKTDGWHDAAFFNMCRPLELVFSSGADNGEQIGPLTKPVEKMSSFKEFWDAYADQMGHAVNLMVSAVNSIDQAHMIRCPLPFQSALIDDCISKGKSLQEGGAAYSFTGPQGFGIANVADSMMAVRQLVFEQKKYTLADFKEAMAENYGRGVGEGKVSELAIRISKELEGTGVEVGEAEVRVICQVLKERFSKSERWNGLLKDIEAAPKYGNDIPEVDELARKAANLYSKEVQKRRNPRGGVFQAGLYPVSANVPLGAQTGATPDGRLAGTPVADGVGPAQGRDLKGPTSACNSVARLDHIIASNGTLFNQKFHPSAMSTQEGLEKFVALVRGFFDQKGMHLQFNVVSAETLKDAQSHPENYKGLVVRVAGYSALFSTLSKSLQDDIISRTTHGLPL
ncbi:MAG: glycyl radical protein [Clostridiales bacterium]|jgi:formate C-acetyltransferase|nr:glycyl radical protein [Clostridiales bacterium]